MWHLNHEEKTLVLTNKKLLYILGKIERYDALFAFYKKIIIPKSVLTELEFFAPREYPNFINLLRNFRDKYTITLPTKEEIIKSKFDREDTLFTQAEVDGFTIVKTLCKKEEKEFGDFNNIMTSIEVDGRDEVELHEIAGFFTPNNVYWFNLFSVIIEEKYINYEQAVECLTIADSKEFYASDLERDIIRNSIKETFK